MKLTQTNLTRLSKNVAVPKYDRNAVQAGILHVGVGNFHRAHQAVYFNDLLNAGHSPEWGICGAGVCPPDTIMRDRLAEQNWLSSVVEIDGNGMSAGVTGSMIDFLPVMDGHGAIINAMGQLDTRIVSLTVTEGGYFINAATGEFDPGHPDIQHDAKNLKAPRTVFGAIVAGLALRRQRIDSPMTVKSCDNLPGNGTIARAAVLGLAKAANPDLALWIEEFVTFPNGMVDRITPATSERERALVQDKFGIEDAVPVFCEPFRQWVLEDNFANGRPELEAVGVTLIDSVHDYEAMKIRVLNGGHAIIAYPAGLAGIEFVHDAMQVPEFEAFLSKVETQDILPNVMPIKGQNPADYLAQTIERFKNPGVGDTVARLCLDGSNRQPKFIVPAIRDMLAAGVVPEGLVLSSALWCHYCAGVSSDGAVIPPNDPNWDELSKAAEAARTNPLVWLEQEDIYGDLRQSVEFCDAFRRAHVNVQNLGVLGAIRFYLAS